MTRHFVHCIYAGFWHNSQTSFNPFGFAKGFSVILSFQVTMFLRYTIRRHIVEWLLKKFNPFTSVVTTKMFGGKFESNWNVLSTL